MNSETIVLSLGSNIGQRERMILDAALKMAQNEGFGSMLLSSLYETEPVEVETQNPFINACCIVETVLEPRRLLQVCKELERAAGRELGAIDRPLDIDLILFGDREISEPDLFIPHPRFRHRRFVIEPLAEIAPEIELPPDGIMISELSSSSSCRGFVRRISSRRILSRNDYIIGTY
jgi:2-amino-4-hydroxy-6-hydroxymethyldihydropteridine diphosphokinase